MCGSVGKDEEVDPGEELERRYGPRLRRLALRLESVYGRLGERGSLFEIYPTLLVTPVAPASVASRKEAAGIWARYGDLLNVESARPRRLEKAARAYGRACALDPEGTLRFGARRDLLQRLEAHADELGDELQGRVRTGVRKGIRDGLSDVSDNVVRRTAEGAAKTGFGMLEDSMNFWFGAGKKKPSD